MEPMPGRVSGAGCGWHHGSTSAVLGKPGSNATFRTKYCQSLHVGKGQRLDSVVALTVHLEVAEKWLAAPQKGPVWQAEQGQTSEP